MLYTDVVQFATDLVAARNVVGAPLQPVPAHCLRIGHNDALILATATGNFNSYSGGFPAEVLDTSHYVDIGSLYLGDLGEAQDARETLAGYGLWFDDWSE
jgi:hypothetical protein